jgi:hypothetical protein
MKKQYYIKDGRGFRRDIILYHDGVEVDRIKTWDSSSYEHIIKLREQGYTEGFLSEDIEEAYDNFIEKLQKEIVRR